MKKKPKLIVVRETDNRVLRGGGVFSVAQRCRSASRDWLSVGYAGGGFRLVRTLKKAK